MKSLTYEELKQLIHKHIPDTDFGYFEDPPTLQESKYPPTQWEVEYITGLVNLVQDAYMLGYMRRLN